MQNNKHDQAPDAQPSMMEKLLYVRTEVRADQWEIRFQYDGGGAWMSLKKGEPISRTVAELRRLADLLEQRALS